MLNPSNSSNLERLALKGLTDINTLFNANITVNDTNNKKLEFFLGPV